MAGLKKGQYGLFTVLVASLLSVTAISDEYETIEIGRVTATTYNSTLKSLLPTTISFIVSVISSTDEAEKVGLYINEPGVLVGIKLGSDARTQLMKIFQRYSEWRRTAHKKGDKFSKTIGTILATDSSFYMLQKWYFGHGDYKIEIEFLSDGPGERELMYSFPRINEFGGYMNYTPSTLYLNLKQVKQIELILSERNIKKKIRRHFQEKTRIDRVYKAVGDESASSNPNVAPSDAVGTGESTTKEVIDPANSSGESSPKKEQIFQDHDKTAEESSVGSKENTNSDVCADGAKAREMKIGLGRSKNSISEVTTTHRAEIRTCFEEAISRNSMARGKIVVGFSIAADGKVFNVDIKENTINDLAISGCISKKLGNWLFPKIEDAEPTIVAAYPIYFCPKQ